MSGLTSDFGHELGFIEKLRRISWGLVVLVLVAASCGIAVLYSATAPLRSPLSRRQWPTRRCASESCEFREIRSRYRSIAASRATKASFIRP